jgi:starch synthase
MALASPKSSALRVLFATSECAPLAKTGGLGDVSAALPPALRRLKIDVKVLLPGYGGVLDTVASGKTLATLTLSAPPVECRLIAAELPSGVPLIVVDCPPLYRRDGGPYQDAAGVDWPDNAVRFGALSQVAAILGGRGSPLDWRPHIVHCNDWQTGLAPAYLRYQSGPRASTVMTVHNLAFHGSFPPELVAALGLPPASYAMEGLEFYGRMSFLKAGLFYADAITTVSPTYARQIRTEEYGSGMDGLLRARGGALTGIRNGIDTAVWNPAGDPMIERRYGARTLNLKRVNKEALQRRLRLAVDSDVPLLGIVTRYTHQKGSDLLAAALPGLVNVPVQLAALGSGERTHEDALRALAAHHPGKIAAAVGFDEALAHLIEAGADMFLMPSRFEPCGLNQMYSQRYGTPPVARATGGLADTIVDCTPETLAAGTATGFLFTEPAAEDLDAAVRRAIGVYRDRGAWRSLQRNGMARDFGWTGPAGEYAEVYRQVAGTKD